MDVVSVAVGRRDRPVLTKHDSLFFCGPRTSGFTHVPVLARGRGRGPVGLAGLYLIPS